MCVLYFCDLFITYVTTLYLLIPIPYFEYTPNPSLWATTHLISASVSLFSSCFVCLFCFLDSTYKWDHAVFFFLYLTYFTWYNTLQIYLCCCKWQDFTFYGWIVFHCIHIPHLLYPFLYGLTLRLLQYLDYWK